MANMPQIPETRVPTTFVLCLEYGSLAEGVIYFAESLRRLGGDFGSARIIAVTPRSGPRTSKHVRDALKKYDVLHIKSHNRDEQSWFKFLNKPMTLCLAERHITTEQVTWVDSDIVFLKTPEKLILGGNEDFCACAPEKEQGTEGENDPFEPIWRSMCQLVGVSFEQLGWVLAEYQKVHIRTYWNSGVFTYRRHLGFAEKYLEFTRKLLEARVISKQPGFYIGIFEQASAGFAAAALGMRIRSLPPEYNYPIAPFLYPGRYSENEMRAAAVLHYHESIWAPFFSTFVDCMRINNPGLADWFHARGPFQMPTSLLDRVTNKAFKSFRKRKESQYLQSCRSIEEPVPSSVGAAPTESEPLLVSNG
jgi:hypothetical protein